MEREMHVNSCVNASSPSIAMILFIDLLQKIFSNLTTSYYLGAKVNLVFLFNSAVMVEEINHNNEHHIKLK